MNVTLAIIIAYLVLLLILGLASNKFFKGTAKDYFVASHSIGPFLLLMSVFGTTMTAFALVGSTGESYRYGIGTYGKMASWSGLIHSAIFFLIGIRLWGFGKKYGYVTQIQYFRARFESNLLGYLLFPILVGLVIPYLLIGILGAGSVVRSVTAGSFPNTFTYPDKRLTDKFDIKRDLDRAKQTYLFAALDAVVQKNPDNASKYEEITGQLQSKGIVRLTWSELDLLKTVRQDLLEEQSELLMDYDAAITAYKKKAMELKASSDFRTRRVIAGSFVRRAKATTREKKVFRISGIVKLAPDRISNPMNGGVPPWLTGLVICTVVLSYIFFGGLRGAAWANAMQTIVFMVTGIITFLFIATKLGGVANASHIVREWSPHTMTRETIKPVQFLTYLFVPLSVGMFPHLFQHWLTARSAKTFRVTVIAHPLFIMIVWVPCVLIGAWATAAMMPGAGDFSLIVPIDHPPNSELAIMVKRLATPALVGLLSAGILAAIMSSLDSQFLCLGTMFTNDIVLHRFGADRFTDKQKVLLARLFIVGIVAITYGLSLFEPRRVFTLGVWCFSGFGGLFPVVFAAVWWKRCTKAGTIAAVVVTAGVWVITFVRAGFGMDYGLISIGSIHGIMPAAVIFAACAITLVIVSLITKPPSDETVQKFFVN